MTVIPPTSAPATESTYSKPSARQFPPPACPRLLRERHLRDDETVVGSGLEAHALRHAIDDDFLEQLEPGLFFVDDLRGLGVELLSLPLIQRVAGLLHQIVEALAGLVADPVLAAEAIGMEQAPQAPVSIEQRRLRIDQHHAVRRQQALVVHLLARRHL